MKYSKVKENIIQTASFLFYKNGYNSTGINEIIAEAGIAKATLYNHFKSKEDICIAYLKFKNSSFLTDLWIYIGSKKKGKAQILGLFDFLNLFFCDKDFNGCWCIKTVAEIPKENEKIRREIQSQKNMFIQLITDLVRAHSTELSEKEIISQGRRIYLLYESAVTESHLHQEEWPILEAKNLCTQIMG